MAPALDQVVEKYPDRVKLVYKNYPLRKHAFSYQAAAAALAAGEQGQFWGFHDLLFENQNELSERTVVEIAQALGLDMQKFDKDRKDARILSRINDDRQEAAQAGVHGTPTIFINGRPLRVFSPEGIRTVIEKELERRHEEKGEASEP